MKLTNKLLTKLVEEVLNEQPPQMGQKQQQSGQEEEPQEKPLKTDIPNSPFEPDVSQVRDELGKILKQWEIKQYPSDEVRWKLYYKDILSLFNKLKAEEHDEV